MLKAETSTKLLEGALAERNILKQQLATARNEVLGAEVDLRQKEAKMGEYQRLLEVERKSHGMTKQLLETNNQSAVLDIFDMFDIAISLAVITFCHLHHG